MSDTHLDNDQDRLAALAQSEEKYRSLFERMNEGITYYRIIYNEKYLPTDYITEEVNIMSPVIVGFKKSAKWF